MTRRKIKESLKNEKVPRVRLTQAQREEILNKTGKKCHICGGTITDRWEADHVLSHSKGGGHSVDNYLAAHPTCNNYRWDYMPEEFQEIMKLGIWMRTQVERNTKMGLPLRKSLSGMKLIVYLEGKKQRTHKN
jgi:hypothetical protein